MTQSSQRPLRIQYDVIERRDDAWDLPEENMPQSVVHGEAVRLLFALLSYWAASQADVFVAADLAVRWIKARPNVGLDPDVAIFLPAPPDASDLTSIRTWMPGHAPPKLAIEVVSNANPRKDYVVAPEKYAASGTNELWIFDPLLAGPIAHGGPVRLQLWTRNEEGDLVRTYSGEGPVFSPVLNAWLVVIDEGRKLRIAEDETVDRFWLTGEEAERAAKDEALAAKDEALAAKDEALAAKDAALARIAELEAKLVSGV